MGQGAGTKHYRADIDGLRAIAVLGVVLYHAGVPVLSGGFTGVDIFFVISGYLIGGHIFEDLQRSTFSFVTFYYRRAKRILPACFLVIGICLLAGALFLSPMELRHFAAEVTATNLFVSNLYFSRGVSYFAPELGTRPLLMTWSLGIEEQFYFVVPVLLVVLHRRRPKSLLRWLGALFLLSFAIAIVQVRRHPEAAFFLLPSRAWELGAGVILAVSGIRVHGRAKHLFAWAGLTLLVLPFLLLTDTDPFPGLTAVPSVAGTVLLLLSERSLLNRQILSFSSFRYIGRRSYSWYLWHWPLLAFARTLYGGAIPLLSGLLTVTVALGLAAITYRYVEQPFRQTRLAPGPFFVRYAAILTLFVLMGTATFASVGWEQRFPDVARQEAMVQGPQSGEDRCMVMDGTDRPKNTPECDETEGRLGKVALWGDSHAGAIAGVLRDKAHSAGLGFMDATKVACPPLGGVERWYAKNQAHAGECSRFDRNALAAIVGDPTIKTVILAAYWPDPFHQPLSDGWLTPTGQSNRMAPSQEQSDALLRAGLTTTITALQRAGRRVLVMEDVPSFRLDPVWRLRTEASPVRRLILAHWRPDLAVDPGVDTPAYPREDHHVDRVLEEIAHELAPVGTFDLSDALCDRTFACRYRAQGETLYRDRQHLSPVGAALALQPFSFSPDPDSVARWQATDAPNPADRASEGDKD